MFRGSPDAWRGWLEEMVSETGATDIVYYNDCFPYHRTAMEVGQARGLRTWCVEFGYLRPDWITLEPGGMGGRSRLRSRPVERLAGLGSLPDMTRRFPHRFTREALNEVTFNLLQVLARPLTPRFQHDRPLNPVLEYLGWAGHLARSKRDNRDLQRIKNEVRNSRYPYFLLPLQMEGDYQVRTSRYAGMDAFVVDVLRSFRAFAHSETHLLIKAHPLESGLSDWRKVVRGLARTHGLEGRVHYFRGGDLGHFAKSSRGLVTLNSTSGMESLRLGVPTVVLGEAVYERPGLTHQSGLDSFWTHPEPVDPTTLSNFLKALSLIQVKGSFYNAAGVERAVADMSRRMTESGPLALHAMLPLA